MDFKIFDIFGRDFKFYINGKKTFKTYFGLSLSLTLGVAYVIGAWYFGKDIYYRKNPIFLKQESFLSEWPSYILSNKNFTFAIRFEDDDQNLIEDVRYFEYLFIYKHYFRDSKNGKYYKNASEVPIYKCNSSLVANEKSIKAFNLDLYYCAKFENLFFGGGFGYSNEVGLLEYRIRRCSNHTEKRYNNKCKTNDEINEKYLGKIHVSSYVTSNVVRPKNYDYPI